MPFTIGGPSTYLMPVESQETIYGSLSYLYD
jgi:hypothetical protein